MCVFFDYGAGYDSGFDDHCAIDKDLLLRRSHTSRPFLDDNNIHNLKISNATQSDRGQYLCVLQVNIYNQQYWAVITNTTVIVDNPGKTMNLTWNIISSQFILSHCASTVELEPEHLVGCTF